MEVKPGNNPGQVVYDERVEPPTTLAGWRRFVEKDSATYQLVSPERRKAMSDRARDTDDERRIDYHSELQVVRTSTVEKVCHQGRLLTLLNRRIVTSCLADLFA